MIDHSTEKYIEDIGRSIPKELFNKLQKVDDPITDTEMEYRIARLMNTGDKKIRDKMKYLKENGAFQSERTYSIDPKAEREIEKFWEAKIGQAIRSKRIPPCKLDAFARRHMGV